MARNGVVDLERKSICTLVETLRGILAEKLRMIALRTRDCWSSVTVFGATGCS